MEVTLVFLLIILFVILIAVILGLRNSVMDRFDRLEQEIRRLREEAQAAPRPGQQASTPPAPTVQESEPFRPVFRRSPAQPVQQPPPANAPASASKGTPASAATGSSGFAAATSASTGTVTPSPQRPKVSAAPPGPGFFEKHPDLEKFIGENLISKIGIAILVLGIGFFVKYAIDNDWLGPVGRVGIGVLCGGVLIGIAHWLRNQYKAFSSVLVGGGLAVLYFSIALAYHEYHLFGQTVAFVIMLVITAFSVLLSLLYDRQELAIIALLGGFVTPFLVSNGKGDYVTLFTYLLILNTGLLVIAYNKVWRLLNILAFCFTAILFATWMISLPYDASAATYRGGWGFATAFYLLFFVINITYTIRKNKSFVASDFGILLVNTCLYFSASLYLITQLGLERYKGLFCAIMGVFHLGATWFLFQRKTQDKNVLYLLIGITLSFVSLTAPLQLHGHYITMFWATEAVLLYWLFLKSGIRLIRVAAVLVWLAMLVSLGMDWLNFYMPIMDKVGASAARTIFFNKGCMTGLFSALCCAALFVLGRRTAWARVALISCAVLIWVGGLLEINAQLNGVLETGSELGYTNLCVLGFVLLSRNWPDLPLRQLNRGLLIGGILLFLLTLPLMFQIQEENGYKGPMGAHIIAAMLMFIMCYRLIRQMRTGEWNFASDAFTWFMCTVVVIALSAEGLLLVNALWYTPRAAVVYNKTALPILWGLCSFAFMWLGMRYKFKPLRMVSLALFSITLLKLFLFDIRNIPVAGKIAAFFCLGVLLLVVSFMYQRLKKIIIEDEDKKTI